MYNSRRLGRTLVKTLPGHVFAILVVIICLVPVLVIINASLHASNSFQQLGFSLTGITLQNFFDILETSSMARWIGNSLLVCTLTTLLELVVDLTAAFAFAKLRFRGRRALFLIMISTMMLPFSITLVPTYLLAVRYGMVNTYAGLIIPAAAGPFGVYLLRQFILTLPDSLIEAATIDGASTFRVFLSIITPLCFQPLAVLAIFTFVNNWNSFLWPLLVTQSDNMYTLTVGIATTNLQFSQNIGATAAGATISLIPMAILFFVFQRFFLQGVTAGASKG
jgi:ABC-type glycerol-3-phosphate transport system permease component